MSGGKTSEARRSHGEARRAAARRGCRTAVPAPCISPCLIFCWGLALLLPTPSASGADLTCEWPRILPEVLAISDAVGVADILSVSRKPLDGAPPESENVQITCELRWVKIIYRSLPTCIADSPVQTLQFTESRYGRTCRVGRYFLFVLQCGETVFEPVERVDEWDYRCISDGVYVPPYRRREFPEYAPATGDTDVIIAFSGRGGMAAAGGANDGLTEDDRRMKGGVPLAAMEKAVAALLPPDGEQVFEAVGLRLEKKRLSNLDQNGRYWLLRFETYDLPCKVSPPENSTIGFFRFNMKGYCLRSQFQGPEVLPAGPEVWTTHFMIAGEWRSGTFMINRITNRHTGEEFLHHAEPAAPTGSAGAAAATGETPVPPMP